MSDLKEPPAPPQSQEPPNPPKPPDCPQEVAEIDLAPYLLALRDSVIAGWDAWELFGEVAPALRLPLSNRSRANFIYDHITATARARFADFSKVKIVEKRGFLELLIAGRYVLRFKKLNKKKRSSNIPTKQQLRWFSIQLELPEMPPEAVKLIAGYQLNILGTDIENILVTRPVGQMIEWSFSLSDIDLATNVVEFPGSREGHPTAATPRSTRKSEKEKAKDKDGE